MADTLEVAKNTVGSAALSAAHRIIDGASGETYTVLFDILILFIIACVDDGTSYNFVVPLEAGKRP